jgi:hypothetical protein
VGVAGDGGGNRSRVGGCERAQEEVVNKTKRCARVVSLAVLGKWASRKNSFRASRCWKRPSQKSVLGGGCGVASGGDGEVARK